MGTPALYKPDGVVVDVIQDGEELAFVKFPGGKVLWVKSAALDFDDLIDDAYGGHDWGEVIIGDDEVDDDWEWDEDFEIDSGDHYDFEYDR